MKLPEGIPLWETYYQMDDGIRSTQSADDCRTSAEIRACLSVIERGARLHSAKAVYGKDEHGNDRIIMFYLRFTTDEGHVVMRFRPDGLFGCLSVSFLFIEKDELLDKYLLSGADDCGIRRDELKGWDSTEDNSSIEDSK